MIIIHIGLMKTGTTFLQRNVFSYIPNVNISLKNPIDNDIKILNDKINIISYEQLTGVSHIKTIDNRIEIIKQLNNKYPNAKIIICLREINSWLRSLYSQYIKRGGVYDYDGWYKKIFNKSFLCWYEYLKTLKILFKDVLILTFEELKQNQKDFIKRIYKFIELDYDNIIFNDKITGKSLKEFKLELVRNLNILKIKPYARYYWFETNILNRR